MASSFGQLFRITTWGESHGGGVGVVVDGCPPRLKLSEADIQPDLDRRRPGPPKIVTPRKESDTVQLLAGTSGDKTLGTPICLWVKNEDARSEAYSEMKTKFRPSHADFTYFAKYGIRAWQGGGRASARETIGRVAAGAIDRKSLPEQFDVETLAYVKQVRSGQYVPVQPRLLGRLLPRAQPGGFAHAQPGVTDVRRVAGAEQEPDTARVRWRAIPGLARLARPRAGAGRGEEGAAGATRSGSALSRSPVAGVGPSMAATLDRKSTRL